MELPNSDFFYTLATLAMTFAGFTAIVVTLRQGTGNPLSPLHVLFTRFFIECGLMAAFFAILPPLFVLSGIAAIEVRRISSVVLIAVALPYCIFYPRRRRIAAPGESVPPRFYFLMIVNALAMAALVANAIGWPFPPNSFPVAFFIVYVLCAGALVFLATYSVFVSSEPGQHG